MPVNSGPIPGANMVRDKKNFPWHQAPKITDLDTAIDFLVRKLTDFKTATALLTMAEVGLPLVKVSQIVLMQGVSAGYWSVDMALLLSGPLTRIIELICIGYDVKYDLGVDDDPNDFETANIFKGELKLQTPPGGFKLVDSDINQIKQGAEDQGDGSSSNPENGSGTGNPVQPQQTEQPLQGSGFMAMQGQPQVAPQGGQQQQGATK